MEIIIFEDFSCYYKNKTGYTKALDHLDFSIESGELFVIAGKSGCGKTTLLKCILGQCEYTEGNLFIDGVSMEDFDVKSGNIGYVRQETDLYPHLTVYENFAFPLRMMHTAQSEVDRRVKKIADKLDIRYLLTRKPRQLSGGQHQRVAIARALVNCPSILLFDEPFSNFDPTLRGQLRQLVKQLHQDYQVTMLFVTHDLEEAFSLADRILVLDDGKLVGKGTHDELFENCETYREICLSQLKETEAK